MATVKKAIIVVHEIAAAVVAVCAFLIALIP